MLDIKLGTKLITKDGGDVYIIAEIGQNHQGDINIAKTMIREAKKVGCDCVKFQKSCLTAKFTRSALNRSYNGINSFGNTYGEHKAYLEFSNEQYRELQIFCKDNGIDFTASAMDEISLQFLDDLNVPFIKIGSGDTNNFPLIEKAALLERPLIISTGMQTMQSIEKVVDILKKANKTNYALLHCVSSYPTDPIDCQLNAITMLRERFPHIVVGYSGHEIGTEISEAAILLGARILERHFTLDKAQKGSDHKCSLEPQELRTLIERINIHKNNGNLVRAPQSREEILRLLNNNSIDAALQPVSRKIILPCELPCKEKLGKSIVSARNLKRGQNLQRCDVCIKVSEPNGIPAERYYLVLGMELKEDVEGDHPIMPFHLY